MEYRTLELTLVSAKGLKNSSFIGKMDVYAVALISGTAGKTQKIKTHVDKEGGSDPTWNFPMKFTINESVGQQNRLTLVIKIKAVGMLFDKNRGEIHVPIKELLEGVSAEGKSMQSVSYQARRTYRKPKGFVSFSYKFGEKFEESVTAYPPPYMAEGRHYQPKLPPAGYTQQPGYGSYPSPPPPPCYGGYPSQPGYAYPGVQQPQRSTFGTGFGTGLLGGALGGLLIGDIMSHGGGYGGGCGGGCGGGGCGGGGGGCGC